MSNVDETIVQSSEIKLQTCTSYTPRYCPTSSSDTSEPAICFISVDLPAPLVLQAVYFTGTKFKRHIDGAAIWLKLLLRFTASSTGVESQADSWLVMNVLGRNTILSLAAMMLAGYCSGSSWRYSIAPGCACRGNLMRDEMMYLANTQV